MLKCRKRKSDILSCLKEHEVLLCWTAITQTPVLLKQLYQSLPDATHRFHTYPHYTNGLRALVLREDLKSICPLSFCFLFPKMAGKSTEFSRTHILRDAPRLTGEQAHWPDYKETWTTSYSSTAVIYETCCRGKRGQSSTCLFQMTQQ